MWFVEVPMDLLYWDTKHKEAALIKNVKGNQKGYSQSEEKQAETAP